MVVVLKDLVADLHKRREKMVPSILLRRNYLARVFAEQIRSEKDLIDSHIDRLPPGVRRVYLTNRLAQLKGVH